MFLPCVAGGKSVPALIFELLPESFDAARGRARVRRDFRALVSPLRRTERHTAMCGGCGGSIGAASEENVVPGEGPALSSSVRAPVSSVSTIRVHRGRRARIAPLPSSADPGSAEQTWPMASGMGGHSATSARGVKITLRS